MCLHNRLEFQRNDYYVAAYLPKMFLYISSSISPFRGTLKHTILTPECADVDSDASRRRLHPHHMKARVAAAAPSVRTCSQASRPSGSTLCSWPSVLTYHPTWILVALHLCDVTQYNKSRLFVLVGVWTGATSQAGPVQAPTSSNLLARGP